MKVKIHTTSMDCEGTIRRDRQDFGIVISFFVPFSICVVVGDKEKEANEVSEFVWMYRNPPRKRLGMTFRSTYRGRNGECFGIHALVKKARNNMSSKILYISTMLKWL